MPSVAREGCGPFTMEAPIPLVREHSELETSSSSLSQDQLPLLHVPRIASSLHLPSSRVSFLLLQVSHQTLVSLYLLLHLSETSVRLTQLSLANSYFFFFLPKTPPIKGGMEQDAGGEGDLVPIFSHWLDKNTWGGGWSRELWTSPLPLPLLLRMLRCQWGP